MSLNPTKLLPVSDLKSIVNVANDIEEIFQLIMNIAISDEITRQFGLKPHEFGENIRDNYQRHDVNQCPLEPLELAKDYVCP